MNRTILQGDVLEKLAEIDDLSIDCIISSPPYWGLRDYGTGKWVGGDINCKHDSIRRKTRAERGGLTDIQKNNNGSFGDESKWSSKICPDCDAHYEDGQLGLEPDFRDYLSTMNDIMIQLKRVLKNTGTCWINLGDTYSATRSYQVSQTVQNGINPHQLTPKNSKKIGIIDKSRVGIPERFYINCIDDGWIARNHIPWYKANSMPSSVKDRFTNKWESIFFFAKQQKYYFDLDSVREKTLTESKPFNIRVRDAKNGYLQQKFGEKYKASEKEIENYDDDHITKKTRKMLNVDGQSPQGMHRFRDDGGKDFENPSLQDPKGKNPGDVFFINPKPFPEAHFATFPVDLPTKILKCACPKDGIVLDPFFGSGTVGVAAEKLGLRWCGIELNEEYIKIARKRLDPLRNTPLESWF